YGGTTGLPRCGAGENDLLTRRYRFSSSAVLRSVWGVRRKQPRPAETLSSARQVHADDLFVIARIDMPVGKRRMRPDHGPAAVLVRRFEQVGAAEFLVTAWA